MTAETAADEFLRRTRVDARRDYICTTVLSYCYVQAYMLQLQQYGEWAKRLLQELQNRPPRVSQTIARIREFAVARYPDADLSPFQLSELQEAQREGRLDQWREPAEFNVRPLMKVNEISKTDFPVYQMQELIDGAIAVGTRWSADLDRTIISAADGLTKQNLLYPRGAHRPPDVLERTFVTFLINLWERASRRPRLDGGQVALLAIAYGLEEPTPMGGPEWKRKAEAWGNRLRWARKNGNQILPETRPL